MGKDMGKLYNISLRLLNATREKKIIWGEHFDENTFDASFANYSVQISEAKYGSGDNDVYYAVFIRNDKGVAVENFTSAELRSYRSDGDSILKELYDEARRSVLGSDKAIDDILGYLEEYS